MNRTVYAVPTGAAVAAVAGIGAMLALAPPSCAQVQASPGSAAALDALRFLPNRGQSHGAVAFVALGRPTTAWLTRDGWTLRLARRPEGDPDVVSGNVVRLRFRGARSDVQLSGVDPRRAHAHFFVGDDPARWASDVPTFGGVVYQGLYEHVDLRLRASEPDGRGELFAYDLMLAPGAELDRVAVQCDGVDAVALRPDGRMALRVTDVDGIARELVQDPPIAWVRGGAGVRRPVACRFRVLSGSAFGFAVEGWDGAEQLVIDPTFRWSTYLGGGSSDSVLAARPAPGGGIVVAGWAGSTDFPTTPGAYQRTGGRDAFVAKLADDGTRLLWSTYLGGALDGEEVRGLDVHPGSGSVVVGGFTGSGDFPTTPGAYQRAFFGGSILSGIGDGFVTALSADGAALRFSTFLGRVGDDFVEAVHVDPGGVVTVAGHTNADEFPTTPGVLQPTFGSVNVALPDGFVARLRADGSDLIWSTYLGGLAQDQIFDLHVDFQGACTVAGQAASENFPVTPGAFQDRLRGGWDGFVARLDPTARSLVFATLLGGDGFDQCKSVDVDARGEVAVAGITSTGNIAFPMRRGGLQLLPVGEQDGYVARLSADGKRLRGATMIGGEADDTCARVRVDLASGDVLVAGWTGSRQFPVLPEAAPLVPSGLSDGFVLRLDAELTTLRAAAILDGSDREKITALFPLGDDALVGGRTWSSDLPTSPGAFRRTSGGSEDGFVARFDLTPAAAPGVVLRDPDADIVENATFSAGARVVGYAPELRNALPRPVDVEQFDVLVAGTGDNLRDLRALRVHEDRDRDGRLGAGDALLADLPFDADDELVQVRTPGLQLPANGKVRLLLVIDTRVICARGAQFAVVLAPEAIVARDPARNARRVPVGAELVGPVDLFSCGEVPRFAGDADGDTAVTCRDVRSLVSRLTMSATDDPDGDGRITPQDVEAVLDRVLARPSVFSFPRVLQREGTVTLRGQGLQAELSVRVGGRELRRLFRSDLETVFRVDPGLGAGTQPMVVGLPHRTIGPVDVEVQ